MVRGDRVGVWGMCVVLFLFCKQKTAYEMRISDWSSDVYSSDLVGQRDAGWAAVGEASQRGDGLVEVEVGWGRGRTQDPSGRQAHAHGVAGEEQAAVGVVQGEVVLRVSGRVDGGEAPVRRDGDLLAVGEHRSEEQTSELQSLMRISYAVFCL